VGIFQQRQSDHQGNNDCRQQKRDANAVGEYFANYEWPVQYFLTNIIAYKSHERRAFWHLGDKESMYVVSCELSIVG
jgi:hypothetical protein